VHALSLLAAATLGQLKYDRRRPPRKYCIEALGLLLTRPLAIDRQKV
jgi:hypothetical protein